MIIPIGIHIEMVGGATAAAGGGENRNKNRRIEWFVDFLAVCPMRTEDQEEGKYLKTHEPAMSGGRCRRPVRGSCSPSWDLFSYFTGSLLVN